MKYLISTLALACMSSAALATELTSEQKDMFGVTGLIFLAVYFFPAIVASVRKHNQTGVFIINLLLGWTVIGWLVALVMACTSKTSVTIINNKV